MADNSTDQWASKWSNDQAKVENAIAKFPATFRLKAFPGDLFRISCNASYVNDNNVVMLYTQRLVVDERPAHSMLGFQGHVDRWADFAKGTESELLSQIRKE
jgi:hypothetical protein